jgi:hypothetical protein
MTYSFNDFRIEKLISARVPSATMAISRANLLNIISVCLHWLQYIRLSNHVAGIV